MRNRKLDEQPRLQETASGNRSGRDTRREKETAGSGAATGAKAATSERTARKEAARQIEAIHAKGRASTGEAKGGVVHLCKEIAASRSMLN